MSSGTLPVSLVCCGLLGTTADDHGIVERAFAEACATQGIVPGTAAYAHYMVGVHQAQGQSAVDVFRGLFPDEDGRAEAAALSFERSFRTAVDRTEISPVPGAEEAIGQLSESGMRVCLITSLSRRLLGLVLDSLRWWRLIDLTLCPEDAPRGCPWPDLMLTAMLRLGVEDVREAAFAASTASEHPGDDAGAGPPAAADAAGRATGVGGLLDVPYSQAQHSCQHLVRPRAAPGHVLRGKREVDEAPPAERVEHDAEQAAGQARDHADPDARLTQPFERLLRAGNRRQAVPVDARAERALEGQCRGFGAPRVAREQPAEHVYRRLAECLVDGHHVMGVVGRPRNDALRRACLSEGMLKHPVVLRRGSEEANACKRDRRPAHLITRVHCSGARGHGVSRR